MPYGCDNTMSRGIEFETVMDGSVSHLQEKEVPEAYEWRRQPRLGVFRDLDCHQAIDCETKISPRYFSDQETRSNGLWSRCRTERRGLDVEVGSDRHSC